MLRHLPRLFNPSPTLVSVVNCFPMLLAERSGVEKMPKYGLSFVCIRRRFFQGCPYPIYCFFIRVYSLGTYLLLFLCFSPCNYQLILNGVYSMHFALSPQLRAGAPSSPRIPRASRTARSTSTPRSLAASSGWTGFLSCRRSSEATAHAVAASPRPECTTREL